MGISAQFSGKMRKEVDLKWKIKKWVLGFEGFL